MFADEPIQFGTDAERVVHGAEHAHILGQFVAAECSSATIA
jgi:hypothetical protein